MLNQDNLLKQLEDRIPTWSRIKQVVSVMLKYKRLLQRRSRIDIVDANESLFGSKLLHQSEKGIKMVQQRRLLAELKILTADKVGKKCDVPFPRSTKINQLDHF